KGTYERYSAFQKSLLLGYLDKRIAALNDIDAAYDQFTKSLKIANSIKVNGCRSTSNISQIQECLKNKAKLSGAQVQKLTAATDHWQTMQNAMDAFFVDSQEYNITKKNVRLILGPVDPIDLKDSSNGNIFRAYFLISE